MCVYLCVSQCSASCGVGYQQRIVSCSVTPSSQALRPYAAPQSSSASTRCPEPHPPGTRPCLLRDCLHTTYWKVGPWSKVKQKTLVRQWEIFSSQSPFLQNIMMTCAFYGSADKSHLWIWIWLQLIICSLFVSWLCEINGLSVCLCA